MIHLSTEVDSVTQKGNQAVVICCADDAQPGAKRQRIGTGAEADGSQTADAPSASGLVQTTISMPASAAVDMKPQASDAPAAPGTAATLGGTASEWASVVPPVEIAPLSSGVQAAVPAGGGPGVGPKLQGPPSKVAATAVTATAPVAPAKAGLGGIKHPLPSPHIYVHAPKQHPISPRLSRGFVGACTGVWDIFR